MGSKRVGHDRMTKPPPPASSSFIHIVAGDRRGQSYSLIMRTHQANPNGRTFHRILIPDQYSSSEQNRGGKTELSQIGRHEGDVTTKCCVGSSTASQNRKMALEEKQMKPK